jgi:hypothetical protein
MMPPIVLQLRPGEVLRESPSCRAGAARSDAGLRQQLERSPFTKYNEALKIAPPQGALDITNPGETTR